MRFVVEKKLKLLTSISNLVFFKKPKRLDYELSEVTASLPGGRKVHRTSQSHKTVKLIILTNFKSKIEEREYPPSISDSEKYLRRPKY